MKDFKKFIKINRVVSCLIFAAVVVFGLIVANFDPFGWVFDYGKFHIFFSIYIIVFFFSFVFVLGSFLLKFRRYRVGSIDTGIHEVFVYVGWSNRFLFVDGVLCDRYHATAFNVRPLSYTIEGGETVSAVFSLMKTNFPVKYGDQIIEPEPDNKP